MSQAARAVGAQLQPSQHHAVALARRSQIDNLRPPRLPGAQRRCRIIEPAPTRYHRTRGRTPLSWRRLRLPPRPSSPPHHVSTPDSQSPTTTVAERVATIHARIEAAARAADRDPSSVQLVAVAKTFGPDAVRAAVHAGALIIGENYLQEAMEKQDALTDLDIAWHFIGAIQSRKARAVAERFDFVHTVDRAKIAQRLAEARPPARGPLNVCIQVNLDGEATKAGVAPDALPELAREVRSLSALRLRGLMALPTPRSAPSEQVAVFRRLSALLGALRATLPAAESDRLNVLSMGMSADLEAAIAAGATHVRIGSALFGPRQRPQENAK